MDLPPNELPLNDIPPIDSALPELRHAFVQIKLGDIREKNGQRYKAVCFLGKTTSEPRSMVVQNLATGECFVLSCRRFAEMLYGSSSLEATSSAVPTTVM